MCGPMASMMLFLFIRHEGRNTQIEKEKEIYGLPCNLKVALISWYNWFEYLTLLMYKINIFMTLSKLIL